MSYPHEALQALLDVREDYKIVHNRVGRLSSYYPWLRDAEVMTVVNPLLCMSDCGTLHGTLHGTMAAPSANIKATQAQLVPNQFAVVILQL